MTLARGFSPIEPRRARILILGSLPSVASLAAQEYYAHPRNAFWPIMGALLGFDASAPYHRRRAALRAAGVALWDVCASAQRSGSLDAAIDPRSLVPNDIAGLLARHKGIGAIYLNGATAARLYRRLILPVLDAERAALPWRQLPSTSPAHASLSLARKLEAWRGILQGQ